MLTLSHGKTSRRFVTLAASAALVASLSFPALALAEVRIDNTVINQGENAVGGGTATLTEAALDMANVVAKDLYIDENLSVNFNGGNEIGETTVAGSAQVDLNFAGENSVEEVEAIDSSNVTINANGHNEFEEVNARDESHLTINVTGENDFESIGGTENATIDIRGTDCQKRDKVNLGEDEGDAFLFTENGDLTIDHVTINLKSKIAVLGSDNGNMRIDTSKIGKDDGNEYAEISVGGTMEMSESVIDITGTIHSKGEMTIKHSDVKAAKPDAKVGDPNPYRISSESGIKLIDEKNGEVREGNFNGKKVSYVDTDDNDGSDVDLKADGEPGYYACKSDDDAKTKGMPKTGDTTNVPAIALLAVASASTALYSGRRRRNETL